MSIKSKDKNRAELVHTIIRQNGGRIFTVVAKRKAPKIIYRHYHGSSEHYTDMNQAEHRRYIKSLPDTKKDLFDVITENFMTLTCRTGVKKDLASNEITHYVPMHLPTSKLTISPERMVELLAVGEVETDWKPVHKVTKNTIKHCPDLISVNLTNGNGYRCFSVFNVLEVKCGGAVIKFKESDVLAFGEGDE